MASKKRSKLVWIIPVVLVVIALIIGLVLTAYKYRRIPRSLLASGVRGKHRLLTDDYENHDGNMGLTIHEGIFYVRLLIST